MHPSFLVLAVEAGKKCVSMMVVGRFTQVRARAHLVLDDTRRSYRLQNQGKQVTLGDNPVVETTQQMYVRTQSRADNERLIE